MKTKCRKSKQPCKICLEPVFKKTGFQCQGKCRQWVHFKCMAHPTKGRLMDMKAGVLKVFCPCPDCKANNISKEFYVDANECFLCAKTGCPAKRGPVCGNSTCPGNRIETLCDMEGRCNEDYAPGGCVRVPGCRTTTELRTKPDPFPTGTTCCNTAAPFSPTIYINSGTCPEPVEYKAKPVEPSKYNIKKRKGSKACKPCDIDLEDVCTTVVRLTDQVSNLLNKLKCQL